MSPQQAIAGAAENPAGITGLFRMTVRGAGRAEGHLYLNSETNYRSKYCLTLTLTNKADRQLREQLGGDPAITLQGKQIRASGTARQVTIWLFRNGVRTQQCYFQTQIWVSDAAQLKVLSP